MNASASGSGRRLLLLGALLLAGEAAAQQEAADPCTLTSLELALDAGPDAFARMDDAAFVRARSDALASLACLDEALTPAQAADLHQLMALSAFRDMQDAEAVGAMQSLLQLLPHYRFAPPVVPSDSHPLNELLEQAQARSPGAPVTVDMPKGAVLRVDGARAEERQSALPAVVQVVSEQGEVLWGGYVLPEDPLPPADLPPLAKSPRERLSKGLLIGGGAMALGGVVAIGAGSAMAGQREDIGGRVIQADPSLTPEDAERYHTLYDRSNTLGYGGQAALLAGAAMGGLGLVLVF